MKANLQLIQYPPKWMQWIKISVLTCVKKG